MNKIIFVPTWTCNLKCSYCDYRIIDGDPTKGYSLQSFDKLKIYDRELHWYEWLAYLERFEPFLLEMTGGEPTMKKDLPKLLSHLPPHSGWAITSNTLLTDQIAQMPHWNCIAWTASYHYHSDDKFISNLEMLQRKGIRARITIVITPENHKEGFEKIKMFTSKGFGINLHPVLKQGFSWKEHKDVWNAMLQCEMDNKLVHRVKNISQTWQAERHEMCEAGMRYFAVMPDGTVNRCYSQILTDKNAGYIWNFEPHQMVHPCSMDCMFPCDRDIQKGSSICNK